MKKIKTKVMAILLLSALGLLVFLNLFTIIKWLAIAAVASVAAVVLYTMAESLFLKSKPKK
jgi:hypothetical protein